MPAAEQLCPESSDEERSKFIQYKYGKGRYRRVHPLAASQSLMDQVWSCHSNQSDALLAFVCVACYELIRIRCICIYFLCVFQRLRDIVCCDDIEETMSLICSGAKVIIFIHTYILWYKCLQKKIYCLLLKQAFLAFFCANYIQGVLNLCQKIHGSTFCYCHHTFMTSVSSGAPVWNSKPLTRRHRWKGRPSTSEWTVTIKRVHR